jgi:hypothetical protein
MSAKGFQQAAIATTASTSNSCDQLSSRDRPPNTWRASWEGRAELGVAQPESPGGWLRGAVQPPKTAFGISMNEAFEVTPAPQLTPLSNTHLPFAAF